MQPRAEEIHRVLSAFVQAKRAGEADSRRRSFALLVQGSTPLLAEVRELRGACAMIDIGSSIYTLAYADILGVDPVPAGEGGLRLTVRPGCFASHVAARLRRTATRPWSSAAEGTARPAALNRALRSSGSGDSWRPAVDPAQSYVREAGTADLAQSYVREAAAAGRVGPETAGGTAEGDPTETESAWQEVVGSDAVRTGGR
jgi:hypothetical protein